jgi:hypothetical protein
MSKFEDGSYGSLTGVSLIGKVLAGRCSMKYTRAAAGSGQIPEGMTPKTMTGPAGYVMDAMIAAVTNPVDGECQVTVQIKSDNVETGFYLTNIVLFAEDPDEGEVPFTYLSLENEPEWIRPASSIVGKLATFDLIAAVGDVDAVTAVIDPEAIATVAHVQEMIAEHNADPNAHGGNLGGGDVGKVEITIPATGWASSAGLADAEDIAEGELYQDVPVEGAIEGLVPQVMLHKVAQNIAKAAGMSASSRVLDGAVRFWTQQVPAKDMAATLVLLSAEGGISGGGGSYVLPVATKDRLGGVKLGEGFSTTPDGTLSYEGSGLPDEAVVSPGDTEEMLDEVFPSEEEPQT